MAFVIGSVDKKGMRDGVWVDYDEDTSFKLAFLGDPLVARLVDFQATDLPTPEDEDEPEVFVEKLEAIIEERADSIANHLLKGWKGVEDVDGKPVEFTVEAAKAVLSEDQTFMTWVINEAVKQNNFRKEQSAKKAKK